MNRFPDPIARDEALASRYAEMLRNGTPPLPGSPNDLVYRTAYERHLAREGKAAPPAPMAKASPQPAEPTTDAIRLRRALDTPAMAELDALVAKAEDPAERERLALELSTQRLARFERARQLAAESEVVAKTGVRRLNRQQSEELVKAMAEKAVAKIVREKLAKAKAKVAQPAEKPPGSRGPLLRRLRNGAVVSAEGPNPTAQRAA